VLHSYHLYVVKSKERSKLIETLSASQIQTSINYPKALPFLKCYSHFGHRPEDFPVAEELSRHGLSLPLYPEMKQEQIQHVFSNGISSMKWIRLKAGRIKCHLRINWNE